MKRVAELRQFDRPREKMISRGPESLSYPELMSVILGSGSKSAHVRDIASKISQYKQDLLSLSYKQLLKISGLGLSKSLAIIAAREFFLRLYRENQNIKEIHVATPQIAAQLVSNLSKKKQEYLVCLYLNARQNLIKKLVITKGTLDMSIFHAREVFYPAVKFRAASFILIHNHPSGDVTPSREDLEVTKDVLKASKLMGIPLVDHIIISNNRWGSVLKTQYGNIF